VVLRDATAFPLTVGPAEHGRWKLSTSDPAHTEARMDGDTLVVRPLTDGSLIVKVQSESDAEVAHYVVVQVPSLPNPNPAHGRQPHRQGAERERRRGGALRGGAGTFPSQP
jgi:hypothetical protein